MNVLGGKHRIVTFKNILNLDVRFLLLHCRISVPYGYQNGSAILLLNPLLPLLPLPLLLRYTHPKSYDSQTRRLLRCTV